MKSTRPERINILVCYDVNTVDATGRRRLRKVAKVCEGHGQRVQYSVFECTLTEAIIETFQAKLLDIMDDRQDSLRFYRLIGDRAQIVAVFGRDGWVDYGAPLVL